MFLMVELLYRDFFAVKYLKLGLDRWSDLFRMLRDAWLKARFSHKEDQQGIDILENAFHHLAELSARQKLHNENFTAGFYAARSFLLGQISGIRKREKKFSGGIACGRMEDLSGLPFRAVFIPQLDEGVWPRRREYPVFALSGNKAAAENPAEDLWLFARQLLAAEKTVLLCSGKNNVNGEIIHPAAPLAEIIDELGILSRQSGTAEIPVYKFPISACDPALFDGSLPQTAYNQSMASAAGTAAFSPAVKKCGLPKRIKPLELDISDIAAFLDNPAKVYLRKVPGIYLEEAEPPPGFLELEELDFFSAWDFRKNRAGEILLAAAENYLSRKTSALEFSENLSAAGKLFLKKQQLSGRISGTALSLPEEQEFSGNLEKTMENFLAFLDDFGKTGGINRLSARKIIYTTQGGLAEFIHQAPKIKILRENYNCAFLDSALDHCTVGGQVKSLCAPGLLLAFNPAGNNDKNLLSLYLEFLLVIAAGDGELVHCENEIYSALLAVISAQGNKLIRVSAGYEEACSILLLLVLSYFRSLCRPLPFFLRFYSLDSIQDMADKFTADDIFRDYEKSYIRRVFPDNPFLDPASWQDWVNPPDFFNKTGITVFKNYEKTR
ncbi:MAG: hypothetical protein A2096_14120 [Spirochaetes bacterium GWF1_41_5]|nr:MAG: hypothetical protein A2096_14120 [Spirochaetes bacterium GWF1_41_5]HBE03390.1 hypothetical protein [Spirochaetia bacterium]